TRPSPTPRSPPMRECRPWMALVLVAMATGCAGVPTGGAVHVGRVVRADIGQSDVDVRALPPRAQPGLSPTDVVSGFLRALVDSDGGYEIARTYLTGRAASSWRTSSGVTTYDEGSARLTETGISAASRTVRFDVSRRGFIDAR